MSSRGPCDKTAPAKLTRRSEDTSSDNDDRCVEAHIDDEDLWWLRVDSQSSVEVSRRPRSPRPSLLRSSVSQADVGRPYIAADALPTAGFVASVLIYRRRDPVAIRAGRRGAAVLSVPDAGPPPFLDQVTASQHYFHIIANRSCPSSTRKMPSMST